MKKWLTIGGLVVIVALVGTLALRSAIAFAQGPMSDGPFGGWGGPEGGARFGPGAMGPGAMRPGLHMGQDEFGAGPLEGPGMFGGQIDRQALLAEALGITVEELRAAQEQANIAAVQQAVDKGLITQEEADAMLSRIKLRSYLDREALMAQALGITEEELQAARAEGKPLGVLIYELQLDPATVRTQMRTAYEEAIAQAVTDGVITQEQADQILQGPGFGPGGRGGFGGRGGGFSGPGGFWWR
jgi:hypothetical protein